MTPGGAQTRDVEERFLAAYAGAGALPAADHLRYRAQLRALLLQASPPTVSGGAPEWEWDLALANKLDAIYGAIAARSAEVYQGIKNEVADVATGVARGTAAIGIGLWPLALALVAVLYFYNAQGHKR